MFKNNNHRDKVCSARIKVATPEYKQIKKQL